MKKLAEGAEAIIYLKDGKIIKERISKTYRHPEIDKKIRKKNTRFEARILKRAAELIPVPKVLSDCDKAMLIEMEFIEGDKLRDVIETMSPKKRKDVFERIGKKVAKLHNNDIIHGDLTTSNILIREKIYFIDFGLGFISTRVEDKAVDLHVLKQALESKHHKHFEELFDAVMQGYKEEIKEFEKIHNRFEKVQSRGKYKKRKE